MSDGAVAISTRRVRAISFASGAITVALICALLLAVSRVVATLEHEPIAGVQVEIVPRTEKLRPAPRHRAPTPQQARVSSEAPTGTEIPVDRAMIARTVQCFNLRPGAPRPPGCPAMTQDQLEAAGGAFPTERELNLRANPPQNTAQAAALIPPPCPRGFSAYSPAPGVAGARFCMRGGIVAQESARSAEAICESGGLGPCRPPEFRADEVVRLAHTD